MARADPLLRDKSLLIHAGGRVVAASPQARSQARHDGVQTGWSLGRAQALIPDAIALPRHKATNAGAWDDVLGALYGLTPQIESVRQGLAFAHLKPEQFKSFLQEQSAHGGDCAAHGGEADDRSTAELAAVTASPGTLHSIHSEHSRAFLDTVPLPVLCGVGIRPQTIERLGWFGWNTVGQLAALTLVQIATQFEGSEQVTRYAQANDTRPVAAYVPPEVVTSAYDFEQPACEPGEIEPVLDALMNSLHKRLSGRAVHSVTVALHSNGERLCSGRLLREPTTSARSLQEAARFALCSLLRPDLAIGGVEVQRVEVRLSGLTLPPTAQGSLFEMGRPPVQNAIRAVEDRFPGLLQRVVLADSDPYLPEEGFRFEPATEPLPVQRDSTQQQSVRRAPSRQAIMAPR